MTVTPGRTLSLPVLPSPPDTFGWTGTLTQALQLAFGNVQDRVEDLIIFGNFADRPEARGTATFFFSKDEGKLYFDGLDADSVAKWYWLGAEPVVMMQMVAEAGLDGETGFKSTNDDSTITVDHTTRTITIEPLAVSYDVWVGANKYVKVDPDSVILSADAGAHAVVFNTDGDLVDLGVGFTIDQIIKNNAYVCEVYVNDSEIKWVADERHGLMPWQTHIQQHLDGGTVVRGGLGLTDFSVDGNGSLDAHAEFTASAGSILDEDLTSTISESTSIPVIYKSGAGGLWQTDSTLSTPIVLTGGSPAWNEFTGGAWQLTAVSNNKFFLAHIFATPVKHVGSTANGGYIAIMGQAQYTTKTAARDGANQEISDLITAGLPMAEFAPVGTVIYKANSGYANAHKAAVVSTDEGEDYVSWLNAVIQPGIPPSSHMNLTHRDAASQHPAASVDADVSGFSGILSAADTTVQGALDTVDGHIHDGRYYTESEVDSLLAGKSATTHLHDDRYYTESEADALLAAKAAASHTHDDRYYTETEANSLLSAKADTTHYHDDRYYTESETDSLLAAKAAASHTHDDRYYTETESNSLYVARSVPTWDDLSAGLPGKVNSSGFFQTASATTAENWPINTGGWMHLINCAHSSTGNYYHMQLAGDFGSNRLFFRETNNSGSRAWNEVAFLDAIGGAINATKLQSTSVSATAPTSGQVLTYNGSAWAPAAAGGGGGGAISSTPTIGTTTAPGTGSNGYWTVLDISGAGYLWKVQNSASSISAMDRLKITIDGTVVLDDSSYSCAAGVMMLGPGSARYPIPLGFDSSVKVEVYSYRWTNRYVDYGYQVFD